MVVTNEQKRYRSGRVVELLQCPPEFFNSRSSWLERWIQEATRKQIVYAIKEERYMTGCFTELKYYLERLQIDLVKRGRLFNNALDAFTINHEDYNQLYLLMEKYNSLSSDKNQDIRSARIVATKLNDLCSKLNLDMPTLLRVVGARE